MGTRADFYIGKGATAEWLGSVAWDGYEWVQEDNPLVQAKTPDEFRAAVAVIAKEREDFTAPALGWPWPWDDSNTTDYAYMLIDGEVKAFCFGRSVPICPDKPEDDEDAEDDGERGDFPNMAEVKNVTFGNRSGVMIIGG
jgi:hypothetical protein